MTGSEAYDAAFVVARTPLLPADPITPRQVPDLLHDSGVLDAIRHASADFARALQTDGLSRSKVRRTATNYVLRMQTRPTPFGLFAATSVGTLAGETCLEVAGRADVQQVRRPDFDVVRRVLHDVVHWPEVRERLRFAANPTMYRVAARYRYLARVGTAVELSAIDATPDVVAVLRAAESGATSSELAAALVDEEVSLDAAHAFVTELVDLDVLQPLLEVASTTPDLPHRLADIFADTPAADAFSAVYAADASAHVDSVRPAPTLCLGPLVVAELRRGIDVLHRISFTAPPPELAGFVERFATRFGDQRVPLLQALDPDVGVGFGVLQEPTPLLDSVRLNPETRVMTEWNTRQVRLAELVVDAAHRGAVEIGLTDADLDLLAVRRRAPLPDAFNVFATLAATSAEAVDRGDFEVHVLNVYGPSGARVLGRFCAADQRLERLVRAHLVSEEQADPDAVYAEVVHLPEGAAANVVVRPPLRDFEIPVLGGSGVPPERRIELRDLEVDVRSGLPRLWWTRTGQRVVPRLSCAHRYVASPVAPYRFLCLLQDADGGGKLGWSWGPLEFVPFTPRVRFGRLVLALATWRVSASEVATLTGDEHDLFDAVSRLRSRLGWPRFIAVDRHDGPLSVDLDEPWSVEAFAHSLRRSGGGVVRELWPEPGRLCLRGPEGGYRHELVVPFARRVVARSPTRRVAPTRQHGVDTHPPGSHWLSAKVYVGPGLADSVLTRTVEPLVAKARADGWVDRWFFLRYADPQPHLRVRLRRTEPTYGELLDHVCEHLQPLLDDGTVHRWELDTYQPELHRYGGAAALDLAEQIFEADSNAVVSLLAELPSGRRGADERWRLALLGVAAMLADSGRDAAERLHWLSARGARMREELGLVGIARRQLGGRFRMLRGDLERLLERLDDAQDSLPWIAFRERSQVCRPLFAGLLALDARDELSAALDDVLWSLTHLHVNRVMSTAARQHECLIYDFLSRLLRARLARAAG